jgi:thiamine biosynthesis protein ThiS
MAETAQKEMIFVTVNGEARAIPGGSSIAAMLQAIGLDPRKVAVEHNLEVVPRSTFEDVEVREDDKFEIVHFVGGG